MSSTSNQVDRATASTAASTPEGTRVIEQGPPTMPCSHDQHAPGALLTTSLGGNPLLGAQGDASPEAGTCESPRGKQSAQSHVMHEEVQTDQGFPFRVYVTDTEAESMKCQDGSIDQ